MILAELCQELKNWFCDDTGIHLDTFDIRSGVLPLPFLLDGQYFRIVGSVLNDGVYQYSDRSADKITLAVDESTGTLNVTVDFEAPLLPLTDETFSGAVWAMRIPPSFLQLADEIDEWLSKNKSIISSPYQSESWGGYSYSLKAGSESWKSVFGSSLNRWRKL